MEPHTDGFWAIVEIMGHQTYAGLVTESTLAGGAFVRVDIPETPGQSPFSKLFGPQSIYSITPCKADIAQAMAAKWAKKPLDVYDLPEEWRAKIAQPRLAHRNEDEDDDGREY